MKIMMTGGSGLLGREIRKLDMSIHFPSHSQMDIMDIISIEKEIISFQPDTILHLAADTNCQDHTKHPQLGMNTNIIGTTNVALACLEFGVRLVYTSTDYVYRGPGPHYEDEAIFPTYKFGWSKLGGEAAVSMCHDSLILRLSFGPRPFPWERVYDEQINSKLYVDEIAPLVLLATKSQETGIMNIGGPRTTLLEYARRSRPDIETIPRPGWAPHDTSLNLDKMNRMLNSNKEKQ